jgi:serpin B
MRPFTLKRYLMLIGIIGLLMSSTVTSLAQSGNLQTLAAGNTDFALRLYQQMRANERGNMLFSPYSISQALAMTYAGARGDTAAQMASALSFSLRDDELHRTFLLLNGELAARGNAPAGDFVQERVLRVANALWGEQSYPFAEPYLALVKANYGAGLQPVDFVNNAEATRQVINDWVEKQTNDRIKDILPGGVLTSDTRLVLTNAVYFKQAWLSQFYAENTRDDKFTLLDGKPVTVPMMFHSGFMGYHAGDGFKAVAVPYQSGMSMLVILPDAGKFEGVEGVLNAETFKAITDGVSANSAMVQLYMPRFTFEYNLPLTDGLIALGMTNAFDPNRADFSGMAEVSPGANLYLMKALHKAFIAVDETGTEAAAATAIIAGVTSAPIGDPVEFKMDRPFIFAIRDDQTGSVLFVGRVLNPLG